MNYEVHNLFPDSQFLMPNLVAGPKHVINGDVQLYSSGLKHNIYIYREG